MKNTLALRAVNNSLEPINQILTPRSVETRARARETNAPDTMNQADVDKQINQVRATKTTCARCRRRRKRDATRDETFVSSPTH